MARKMKRTLSAGIKLGSLAAWTLAALALGWVLFFHPAEDSGRMDIPASPLPRPEQKAKAGARDDKKTSEGVVVHITPPGSQPEAAPPQDTPGDHQARPMSQQAAVTSDPAPSPTPDATNSLQKTWALNVVSTTDPKLAFDIMRRLQTTDHTVYTYKFTTQGKDWHRVRLGFFATREEAEKANQRLMAQMNTPNSWIVQPGPEELALYAEKE